MGKIRSDCNNRVLACEVRTHKVVLFLAYATCVLLDWTCCFFAILHYLHCRQRILTFVQFSCFADSYLQLLSKPSKQFKKKKKNPLSWSSIILELTNKLKRLPKESMSWRKLIRIDVCMPLIASYAYDILTSPLKKEKEWSGVKD